jgi:hypothetical protein
LDVPFKPGNRANPRGRPPAGWSLAELIRTALTPEKRKLVAERAVQMAITEGPTDAIRAMEWLAKHGWPDEMKGAVNIGVQGKQTAIEVVFTDARTSQD